MEILSDLRAGKEFYKYMTFLLLSKEMLHNKTLQFNLKHSLSIED